MRISAIAPNQPYIPSTYTSRSHSTGAMRRSASETTMSRTPTALFASSVAPPRDSGSSTIVSPSVTSCKPAATRNGSAKPYACASQPPSAGPNTKPRLNAAPTYANAWPRFSGGTRSPT